MTTYTKNIVIFHRCFSLILDRFDGLERSKLKIEILNVEEFLKIIKTQKQFPGVFEILQEKPGLYL